MDIFLVCVLLEVKKKKKKAELRSSNQIGTSETNCYMIDMFFHVWSSHIVLFIFFNT